jgi:hypothetical protein
MKIEVEMGECDSCREPISAWEWVSGKPYCDVCALIHAAKCELCKDLVDVQLGYQVSRGTDTSFLCPNDLLPWVLRERLNPVECCQPDFSYERGQYVHNDDCTGETP